MILIAKVRETQTMVMMMTETERDSCAKLLQLCLTLCNPKDHSLPGSSVHGIFPATILEWVAMPCPSPGYLPDLYFLRLLHWQVGSLPLALPEKPLLMILRSKQLYFRIDTLSFWSVLCRPINESGLRFVTCNRRSLDQNFWLSNGTRAFCPCHVKCTG